MATTDRRIARDMILPDPAFIRREARTALGAFYAPFSGLRDAWRTFRSGEQNVDPSTSSVPGESPEESTEFLGARGDRYFFSVTMSAGEPLRHAAIAAGVLEELGKRSADSRTGSKERQRRLDHAYRMFSLTGRDEYLAGLDSATTEPPGTRKRAKP